MSNVHINGFQFNPAGLAGLESAERAQVQRYLTARAREINTVTTTSAVCEGGPFAGQVLEVESNGTESKSATFNVGKWSGHYELRPARKDGPLVAYWMGHGEGPAIEHAQDAPARKQAKGAALGKGFAQLAGLVAQLSSEPESVLVKRVGYIGKRVATAHELAYNQNSLTWVDTEFAQFTIGRTVYRVLNTPAAIAKLRARVLKAKKYFADKVLSVPAGAQDVATQARATVAVTVQAVVTTAQAIGTAMATSTATVQATQAQELGALCTAGADGAGQAPSMPAGTGGPGRVPGEREGVQDLGPESAARDRAQDLDDFPALRSYHDFTPAEKAAYDQRQGIPPGRRAEVAAMLARMGVQDLAMAPSAGRVRELQSPTGVDWSAQVWRDSAGLALRFIADGGCAEPTQHHQTGRERAAALRAMVAQAESNAFGYEEEEREDEHPPAERTGVQDLKKRGGGYVNPLLSLPAAQKILALPDTPDKRELERLLRELRGQADELAELSWKKRKAPMAAYWRAAATYSRHAAHTFSRRAVASAKAATMGAMSDERPPPQDLAPGERLAALRKHLGLSVAEMAAKLGLQGKDAADNLRQMERGTRPVSGPLQVLTGYMEREAFPRDVPYSSARQALEAGIGRSLAGVIERDFPSGYIDPRKT